MSTAVSVILEIIKITVPAFIVFITVYFLLREYLANEYKLRMLSFKQDQQSTTLPLRLQAYERLSLFCERISIPNMVLRLRTNEMTTNDLKITLMLAVQQEYEHNITQQVYVSDQLWQIIKIARDDVINRINLVASTLDPQSDSKEFGRALLSYISENDNEVIHKALIAIKKEASLSM